MALVLARLKLALQIGGARASSLGIVAFALAWALGILGGLAGGFLVAFFDSGGSPFGDLLVLLLFVAIFGAWIVLPIATPVPTANIIDPAVLEQYPLSRAQQVTGLVLGGLASPAAAATFLTAAGGVAAVNVGIGERVVAVAGGVLFTVLCVAASSAVRALFAEALSARRGRDVAVIASTLIVVALYVLPHLLRPLLGAAEDAGAILVTILTWTPPGAVGAMGYVLETGDVVGALARLAVVVATIAVALLLWGLALRLHVRGRTARAVASGHHRSAADLALVPLVLRVLPTGPALAAASQHLRYYFFRAPRAAQVVILGPVVGVMFSATQVHATGLTFAVAVGAVAMGSSALLNLFGFDGRGVELTVQTGGSLASVLRGKLLAVSLFLVPGVALLTTGLGIATGMADQIPLALVSALAGLLLAFAVGAACSAWNPYDQEAPHGDRSTIAVRMYLAFGLAFALVYLVGWLNTWLQPAVPVEVVLGAALVLSAIAATLSTRMSGLFLDRHPERLLAAFTPR